MKLVIIDGDHLTEEALHAYFDEVLSQFNKQRVDRHLIRCEICLERFNTLKEENKPQPNVKSHVKRKKSA